jgi:hypothetical protein
MILLIKIFLITWFITTFSPLQDVLTNVVDKIYQKINNNVLKHTVDILYTILSCHMCLSFWTTLMITGDIFSACGVSFVAWLFKNGKK